MSGNRKIEDILSEEKRQALIDAERRGGIPVLTGSILHLLMEWHPEDALGIESVNFQSSADAVNGWLQEKMTSTPSTDVVTVPKEEA